MILVKDSFSSVLLPDQKLIASCEIPDPIEAPPIHGFRQPFTKVSTVGGETLAMTMPDRPIVIQWEE